MVNEVARNLSKDRPELLIYTLAYAATQKPPTITKPEDNVSTSDLNLILAALNARAVLVCLMLSGAAGQVVITLTTMDDGWAVPLTNTSYGPSNTSHAQFLHDIGVWSKITKHLWIWDCARAANTYYACSM